MDGEAQNRALDRHHPAQDDGGGSVPFIHGAAARPLPMVLLQRITGLVKLQRGDRR